MPLSEEPPYGERVVSWTYVFDVFLSEHLTGAAEAADYASSEMQRRRGLVLGQATEVEAVLGEICSELMPGSVPPKMMRPKLDRIIKLTLNRDGFTARRRLFAAIRLAICVRNKCAHEQVSSGLSWAPFATGGGEWLPVVSFVGVEELDEANLLAFLAIEQRATEAATSILIWLRPPSRTGQ